MFKSSRQDTLGREQLIRGEITTAINPLSAQVKHLTSTVQVLREQLSTNSDFSVDALQQIRAEFRAEIETAKLSVNDPAANAGGNMPGSATDVPLVNNEGEPQQAKHSDTKSYATACLYCSGSVPRCIAEYCKDCDCHFHPGHLQLHRDEWACPMVDRDMCRWCEKHIEEHETIIECPVCLYTMHTNCFADHNPCPDGWNNKKLQLGDLDEPELSTPVTPPSGQNAQASAISVSYTHLTLPTKSTV